MEVDWGQAIKVAVGGFVTVALVLSLLATVLSGDKGYEEGNRTAP